MSTDMHTHTSEAIRAQLIAMVARETGLQHRRRRARFISSLIGVATIAITISVVLIATRRVEDEGYGQG